MSIEAQDNFENSEGEQNNGPQSTEDMPRPDEMLEAPETNNTAIEPEENTEERAAELEGGIVDAEGKLSDAEQKLIDIRSSLGMEPNADNAPGIEARRDQLENMKRELSEMRADSSGSGENQNSIPEPEISLPESASMLNQNQTSSQEERGETEDAYNKEDFEDSDLETSDSEEDEQADNQAEKVPPGELNQVEQAEKENIIEKSKEALEKLHDEFIHRDNLAREEVMDAIDQSYFGRQGMTILYKEALAAAIVGTYKEDKEMFVQSCLKVLDLWMHIKALKDTTNREFEALHANTDNTQSS